MTDEQNSKKQVEKIYVNLQQILEKDGFSSAIESANKTLEQKSYDFQIQLFIADTLYKWGLNLEEKKDPNSKEKFQQAYDLYSDIFVKNPNFAYLNSVSEKKRECKKKLFM